MCLACEKGTHPTQQGWQLRRMCFGNAADLLCSCLAQLCSGASCRASNRVVIRHP